jgi:hypothetical protein
MAATLRRFAIYRINGAKPGCVDWLDEIDGVSMAEVEAIARLMFDFDWAAGDEIDLEELCRTCMGFRRIQSGSQYIDCPNCTKRK